MHWQSRFGADGAGRRSQGRCECPRKSEGAAHIECARDDTGKYTRGGEQRAIARERGWHALSSAQFRDAANEYARDC